MYNFNDGPYSSPLPRVIAQVHLVPWQDRFAMTEITIKCTTRHVRLFTAVVANDDLVFSRDHLTLDLDPDNEFIWPDEAVDKVQRRFQELVDSQAGNELTDYNLRRIGSDLEGTIRALLQAGKLSYNPDCRVLNYSMGLPRTPELL